MMRGRDVPDNGAKSLGPTASGQIARLAYARAKEAGIALAPLLRKCGLTEQLLDDGNARLEVRRQITFLNLVAHALADEFLGFHLAHVPDLRALGLGYYVTAS